MCAAHVRIFCVVLGLEDVVRALQNTLMPTSQYKKPNPQHTLNKSRRQFAMPIRNRLIFMRHIQHARLIKIITN